MSPDVLLRALDEVANELPFAIDDFAAANETFGRWRISKEEEDRAILLKWLYCYARRYLATKFMRHPRLNPAELEILISESFRKAYRQLQNVRDPDRFVSYVSVVCKNTFLNHYRRLHRHGGYLEGDDWIDDDPGGEPPGESLDLSVVHFAVTEAIARLPSSLQEVARRRFLDDQSYEEIASATGLALPTLRSYVSKSMYRLRHDPRLQDFAAEWLSA